MSHNHWKILIIEDDPDDYYLVKSLLNDVLGESFDLHWASSYKNGLESLDKGYDILLIDYQLGVRTGLDLIHEADKRGCTAPKILLTGQGNYRLDVEAMRAGVSDYLSKDDITGSVLERSIRYAIERHQAAEALRKAHDELETRVRERTIELKEANEELEELNRSLRSEISERKKAQSTADAERRRLFMLMEQLPALVSLISPDHKVIFANNRFRDEFGFNEGVYCYKVFYHKDEPCDYCPISRILETKKFDDWEITLENGRSFQLYAYPFTDVDGSPLAVELGIDITQRKRVEAELERYNQELLALTYAERNQRQLAEGLVEATIALNTSLNLDEVLDRILEQTQNVIPCRATAILLLENGIVRISRHRGFEQIPEAWNAIQQSFSLVDSPELREVSQTRQALLISETGTAPEWLGIRGMEWVSSYAAVPLYTGNQILGFLNVYSEKPSFFKEEMPERLQAFAAHASVAIQNARLYKELETALNHEQMMRDQLIQVEKFAAMGRMVGSVAHELNNPLQTIKNCLFLLQEDLPAGSNNQEYLDMANSETQRLSNMVTQLRELYRPRIAIAMKSLEVHTLVEDIHQLLLGQLENNRIKWQQNLGSEPVYIHGNIDQLKQVFINLCQNAMDAMQPEGGTLEITQQIKEQQIGITFHDTGPGIAEENKPKLFEPFYTTKTYGLGLGLPICFEIAVRHGGHMTVESQLGKGSSFTIWLPYFPAKES